MNLHCISAWIEHHPGLAAWVQGVGTFLAIVGTAAIAVLQIRAGRRDQAGRALEELQARRAAAALITGTVSRFVEQFGKNIGQKDHLDGLPLFRTIDRSIQGYYDDLALISLGDLQDGVLCERVLVMRSHIINMLEVIESLRAYRKRGGSAKDEIGDRVTVIGLSAEAVVQAAAEFRQRLEFIASAASASGGR